MAVTKTNFINYLRCPRYVALDHFKKEQMDSNVTVEEYRKEEEETYLREILSEMYEEDGTDLIDVDNPHLNIMLPYYNEVEILAGHLAPHYFKGTFKYAKNTTEQESFDCKINGIRYICYVDIYNEEDDFFRIIEVKATSTKKYLSIGMPYKDEHDKKQVRSIFEKGPDGIYYLLEDLHLPIEDFMPEKKYFGYKQKLYDRFGGAGHYVYDLAVQRYMIEHDLKEHQQEEKIPKIKYYLAVLNCEYVFDGTYEGIDPVYHKDEDGNDIVCYFDMTSITKDLMDQIDIDRKKVERYINNLLIDPVPIGEYCEFKKTTKCKYSPICWGNIPKKNSIFNYIDGHHGFVDPSGIKHDRFELVEEGIINLVDMPDEYLNRDKNVLQKKVTKTGIPYMDKQKIKDGLTQITYPIYHLDFETFPCPIPRYYGEKAYTQSVFQFSLHIEREPGLCDKEKDHFEYLAPDHQDNRKTLIQKMCDWIDTESGGTILVYNESFEKTRLRELGDIFPQYKERLYKMREMIFDLMYLVKTNSKLYQELGYEESVAKMFNYYHKDMTGSFSIKKILPLFSNLTYQGMEIGNGMEALVAYATFPKLSELDFKHKYQKLIEYCKQDTWAMVEILKGLRDSVK